MADTKFVKMPFSCVRCGGEIVVMANSGNFLYLTKIPEIPVSRVNNANQHENYNVQGVVESPKKFNAMHRGHRDLMNFFYIKESTVVAYVLGS